jgi:hypothetical protein
VSISLQRQGIGTLAYPFYTVEYAREQKPTPTEQDATLYVVETRETYVWQSGRWVLYSGPALDPALLSMLTDILTNDRLILRELRLIRQGQLKSSVCAEYDGPPEELDE